MECPCCKKETNNPKYCSRSCAAKISNKTPKRKRTRKCSHDGCEHITRSWKSSVCKDHWEEYKKNRYDLVGKTIGDYRNKLSVQGRHASCLHAHIRLFAKSRLKHLSNMPCFNCGYFKHIEYCHIQALSSFPDSALITEVNDESNILPLCPNCHWEFDNNFLDKSIISKWYARLESNKH